MVCSLGRTVKSAVLVLSLARHAKVPYLFMVKAPDSRSNLPQVLARLCAVTYMTEISSISTKQKTHLFIAGADDPREYANHLQYKYTFCKYSYMHKTHIVLDCNSTMMQIAPSFSSISGFHSIIDHSYFSLSSGFRNDLIIGISINNLSTLTAKEETL